MFIKINGKSCTCESGELLINVARRNGIYIPTLCNHASVEEGRACCRLCIVEITDRGRKTVEVSCIYPITHEIEVETNSPKIQRERGVILSLLASRAPESIEIKALGEAYGAPKIGRLQSDNQDAASSGSGFGEANGALRIDNNKCIMCGLCVEACRSLSVGAISTVNRGITKAVSTPYGDVSAVCIGCGACAKICPTEAISLTQTNDTLTIWGKTFELVHCERCGDVIGTKEQIDEARRRAASCNVEGFNDGSVDLNAAHCVEERSCKESCVEDSSVKKNCVEESCVEDSSVKKNCVEERCVEYLCDSCRKEKMAETLAATYGYLE